MITTALEFGFQADHLDSNGITKVQNNVKEDSTSVVSSLLLIYS